jgi:regulator of protease activity HflC (stomatin/prohibitin superfamily)
MGVTVDRVIITDLILPSDLQSAMARRATTETEVASKIRLAEADARVAHIMNEAASALQDPNAMAVRTLRTLETVAATGKATLIVVPPPTWATMRAP